MDEGEVTEQTEFACARCGDVFHYIDTRIIDGKRYCLLCGTNLTDEMAAELARLRAENTVLRDTLVKANELHEKTIAGSAENERAWTAALSEARGEVDAWKKLYFDAGRSEDAFAADMARLMVGVFKKDETLLAELETMAARKNGWRGVALLYRAALRFTNVDYDYHMRAWSVLRRSDRQAKE